MAADDPKQWWQSRTFWTSAAGIVTGISGIVAVFAAGKATEIGVITTAIVAILGNLGSLFARAGAKADAVKVSAEMLNQHRAETGTPAVLPPTEVKGGS